MQLNDDIVKAVNKQILTQISDEYSKNMIDILPDQFCSYELITKRFLFTERTYLFLPRNYFAAKRLDSILESITAWEKQNALKSGNTYVAILPAENASKEMCLFFNGQSFTHFIVYDVENYNIFYDKDFYYTSSKRIKVIIDICVNTLREILQ